MEFYHNPRCKKSRDSLALLQERSLTVTIIQYLKEQLSFDELKEIILKIGVSPEHVVRKGESIFKEKFKGKELSDDQWIQAMIDYPKLMERPIFVNGEKAVVCRPPELVLGIL